MNNKLFRTILALLVLSTSANAFFKFQLHINFAIYQNIEHLLNFGQTNGTEGNDILFGTPANNIFISNGGSDIIYGGDGTDKVIFDKRPIDYTYTMTQGTLLVKDSVTGDISRLNSIEDIKFKANNKQYSASSLLTNPYLMSRRDVQLFGDTENSRLVGMQLSTMKQVFDIPLDGDLIYSVDMVSRDKSYGYGRDSNKLFVLTRGAEGNITNTKTIPLPFSPRTGANNLKRNLTLITGADKPMFALINTKTDRIVASGGRNEITKFDNSNHGSHWATGHGIWLTNNHFVYSDREARELIVYRVHPRTLDVKEISRIKTDSSVHTVIGEFNNKRRLFYAITEGSDKTKPEVIELLLRKNKLKTRRKVELVGDDPKVMSAHHADESLDKKYIYVGSSEGTLNIISKSKMKVVRTIAVGKGAGHTKFVPRRNIAIVTNHHDTFVSVINTTTLTKIVDIKVSDVQMNNTALQSHTPILGIHNRYYYNFATDNGYYFRIDLNRLKMDKKTYTGGTPKQASQPTEVNLIFGY